MNEILLTILVLSTALSLRIFIELSPFPHPLKSKKEEE